MTHPLFPGLDGLMERELARFEAEHPHNMARTSPVTTEADVDLHSFVFEEAARDLVAGR